MVLLSTSTTAVVTVTTTGDRNEWGRVGNKYTRYSLTHLLVQLMPEHPP